MYSLTIWVAEVNYALEASMACAFREVGTHAFVSLIIIQLAGINWCDSQKVSFVCHPEYQPWRVLSTTLSSLKIFVLAAPSIENPTSLGSQGIIVSIWILSKSKDAHAHHCLFYDFNFKWVVLLPCNIHVYLTLFFRTNIRNYIIVHESKAYCC